MNLELKEEMSLHELTEVCGKLMNMVAEKQGEITPEIEAVLKSIDLAVEKKIDGCKFVMNKFETEAEFWRKEADTRIKLARACEAVVDKLHDAVQDAMVRMNVKEIIGKTHRVVLTTTKGRLKIDEALLPDEWKVQEVRMIPEKEKVREALESFVQVPGATLEGGLGIRFFLNKK